MGCCTTNVRNIYLTYILDVLTVCTSPRDMKELFNLRHAQARNVVERIFGVFKKHFQIFSKPVEWPVETQAKLVQVLAVVHNIIRLYDPQDNLSNEVIASEERIIQAADNVGTLGRELSTAERDEAELFRDHIASEMWDSYQDELARRRRRQ